MINIISSFIFQKSSHSSGKVTIKKKNGVVKKQKQIINKKEKKSVCICLIYF
jgi:hypothetical protein